MRAQQKISDAAGGFQGHLSGNDSFGSSVAALGWMLFLEHDPFARGLPFQPARSGL